MPQFINLPHLPIADVEGGEEASKTAPCVDADEMAEVQHPPVNLGRVPHDNGLSGVMRPWGGSIGSQKAVWRSWSERGRFEA